MANTNFTVNVKVQDAELFKDLSKIVLDALSDKRIPEDVRKEYSGKMKEYFSSHQVDEDAE